jgi:hypothetical protein
LEQVWFLLKTRSGYFLRIHLRASGRVECKLPKECCCDNSMWCNRSWWCPPSWRQEPSSLCAIWVFRLASLVYGELTSKSWKIKFSESSRLKIGGIQPRLS